MYNIDKLNDAYIAYNIDTRENLEQMVYRQLGSIIKESQEDIERLSKQDPSYITYDRIMQIYDENNSSFDYKKTIILESLKNNFISTMYRAPIGLIYAEVENDEQAWHEMLNCIKSRDGLLISLEEWNELDMKHYLLLLVKKAFEMCNVNENLIEMLPYEECDESKFDLKKYRFYKVDNECKKNDKLNYVYIENKDFEEIAKKNKNAQIIVGDYEEVVKTLGSNKHNAVSIYTHDMKLAYKMMTQIHADNILINTDISFAKEITDENDGYLVNKHVMYEYINVVK